MRCCHARASAVHVSLSRKSGMLHLLIRDNGREMDQLAGPTAFGLLGTQERVVAIDGLFQYAGSRGRVRLSTSPSRNL